MTRQQAQNVSLNVAVTESLHLRYNQNLLCCTLELHIHLAKKIQFSGQCQTLPEICRRFPFQLGSLFYLNHYCFCINVVNFVQANTKYHLCIFTLVCKCCVFYLIFFPGSFSSQELILPGTVGKPPQVNHNDLFIMFATLQFNQQTCHTPTQMPHRASVTVLILQSFYSFSCLALYRHILVITIVIIFQEFDLQ